MVQPSAAHIASSLTSFPVLSLNSFSHQLSQSYFVGTGVGARVGARVGAAVVVGDAVGNAVGDAVGGAPQG